MSVGFLFLTAVPSLANRTCGKTGRALRKLEFLIPKLATTMSACGACSTCWSMSATGEHEFGFATTAIHAGQEPERWSSAAVVPPIATTTTFKWKTPHEHSGFVYGRSGNPTRQVLEECLAALEHAKYALCYASGLGSTTAIVNLLSAGDHLLASTDLYGGTMRLFNDFIAKGVIEITYADFTNLDCVKKALRKSTKIIWFETPTNPLLKVIDIRGVVDIAKTQPEILVVVDNTFSTPYFQRPLELGVDITVMSLTKYINGHSDVIMGSIATNNDTLGQTLQFAQKGLGIVPSPFDCYLVNRSLKTLAIRMEKHRENALAIAHWITKHPNIIEVYHPELPSHAQHQLFSTQASGHSGVFSFKHNKGMRETEIMLTSLKIFTLAESLGGYESLAGFPSTMSHGSLSKEQKQEMGITDNVIRLSVGLENIEDLIADLEQAFKIAFA